MTPEEKQLLFKDLSARLPYHVRVKVWLKDGSTEEGLLDLQHNYGDVLLDAFHYNKITKIKPYLRPMQSMTEEELNECVCQSGIKDIECPNWQDIPKEKQFEARLNHAIAVFLTDSNDVDWLNAHHFDYRGLIEGGLALEAPDSMYNTKTE